MTKLRIKNGRHRGLDISDANRLQMIDDMIERPPPPLPRRKCALRGCPVRFIPRYEGHIYHSRKCNATAQQRRYRERYKQMKKELKAHMTRSKNPETGES